MPIDVVCPKCQSRLRAPDEVVGKNVRCKKCQEKFKVPNPGPAVDSVGDTQQLSVLEMPLPKIIPPAGKPAPAEPMMLDDSAFDEPPPAIVAAAKPAVLVVDEDDGDRPRKQKRSRDEEDEARPRKKKEKPKPVIGGEPTFAMPGAAEDPVAVHVPPPAHASQFSFERPAPVSKRMEDDDDDRPEKKKKTRDGDEDEGVAPKKPAKGNKTLVVLVAVAAVLFLGCGGAVAGVYFFVIKVADDASKSTWTVGSTTVTNENNNARPTKSGGKPTPIPQAGGAAVTPFVLPEGGESKGPVVAAGTRIALPFASDFVKQIRKFKDPVSGAMLYAIYQSNPGFNGVGAEDTVVRFDIAKKAAAGQFTVPADGFAGARIFDISDSGFRVAIEAPKGRLTVYNFADKVAEIPIDVHAGLTGREGIAGIAFADPDGSRVAIVDKLGAVDVWDVKERQRITTGKPVAGNAIVVAERRKPNAGKGHLASKDSIRGVLWSKGDLDAPIKLPAKTGVPTLLAAKDPHDHFAIVHMPEGGAEREVLIVNKSGAAVWRIPLPAAAGAPRTLQWMGGGAILAVGFEPAIGLVLLDIASKTPAVYTKPGQDKTVLGDTGELYVLADPEVPGKAALVQVSIPGPSLSSLLEGAKTNQAPGRLFAKPEGLSQ